MKRRGMGMLCIAMVFALLFSCVSVPAGTEEANDGWLSITIGDDRNEFDPSGIRMAIYLIATGDYGNWTMEETFSDITVFVRSDGSASVDMTLSQIRQRIADRKIKPTDDGVSDEKGKIEFKELAHGIYYIEMTAGPERLTMSAMLLSVPNSTGSVQVRAMAKYEYETPTPSPTPSPRPTFTPFVPPVDPETPSPTPTSTPSPTPTVPADESPTPTVPPDETSTPSVTPDVTVTPTSSVTPEVTPPPSATPDATPTASEKVTENPTDSPTKKPVTVTKKPVATPAPTEHSEDNTPVPKHVPTLQPNPGETTISLEEYEVALGLFNIQIHVGVCFE